MKPTQNEAAIALHLPAFDAALWFRLETMQFDSPDARLTFAGRLARENGWSVDHAGAVIAEYRRFLYLAARAGHPVTPSDAVDQAWHLHLVYTRHYWDVLCREVLGFDLHHGPTLGGADEDSKFEDWYRHTQESYRAVFGEADAGIWPSPADRFRAVERMQRIDRSAFWVIPKPPFRAYAAWFKPLLTGLSALLLTMGAVLDTGLAATLDPVPELLTHLKSLLIILLLALLLCYVSIMVSSHSRSSKRNRRNGESGWGGEGCGGGCGG